MKASTIISSTRIICGWHLQHWNPFHLGYFSSGKTMAKWKRKKIINRKKLCFDMTITFQSSQWKRIRYRTLYILCYQFYRKLLKNDMQRNLKTLKISVKTHKKWVSWISSEEGKRIARIVVEGRPFILLPFYTFRILNCDHSNYSIS